MQVEMLSTSWIINFLALLVLVVGDKPCITRTTEYGTVCVCNSTYCDTIPKIATLTSGQYQLFSTSKGNLGFSSTTGSFSNTSDKADATVTIAGLDKSHQTIIGFGGAFTDSTGINILRLSTAAQELLLQTYFGEDGVQYSICRIPIGGTDFSTRGYSYCDTEDTSLDSFALQSEDYNYKIPFVKRAIELRGRDNIKLFASAWTAPTWMKNNKKYTGLGKVNEDDYSLWAKYYIKFFDAYAENNITFWGVTTQNEPVDGLVGAPLPNNGFTYTEMNKWVKTLGPVIRNSSYSNLKIMLHDDIRIMLPLLNLFTLSDSEVVSYADGIAVHFYTDFFTPASLLNLASSKHKELFRIATEACGGTLSLLNLEKPVQLGDWARADTYLNSIMDDLSYDVIGWVDWNMALNETGGPNWVNNEVDSTIIVNGTADEFYKEPMFYALGHFSKFIVPNSVRIESDTSGNDVTSLAFVRPDGKIAVILRNRSSKKKDVKVNILSSQEVFTLEANSINTLLYVQ